MIGSRGSLGGTQYLLNEIYGGRRRVAITERQISIRAYSDSDEPSIRRAAEEQYYDKFSEFSKADIQIIMLGERIVGWF